MFIALYSEAATVIYSSTVSGNWTLAGSPYIIIDNVSVPTGATLIVEPGVEVLFYNHCGIHVYGDLYSMGTALLPINYSLHDTTGWATDTNSSIGWDGLYIDYPSISGDDSTNFAYSIFSYMACTAPTSGANIYSRYRAFNFDHCNFSNNRRSLMKIEVDSVSHFEISYCNFEYNYNGYAHANYFYEGTIHLHHNNFHDNISGTTLLNFVNQHVLFYNNRVYNNEMTDTTLSPTIELEGCVGKVQDNVIYGNTSVFTAPLSCDHSVADISRNYICNNTALVGKHLGIICEAFQSGGGIRLNGLNTTKQSYLVRNNLIANNFSAGRGGAIDISNTDASIFNNTIVNNKAGYGGGICISSPNSYLHTNVKIKNNLFYNNESYATLETGSTGYENVYVLTGDTVLYEYNWTQRDLSSDVKKYIAANLELIGDSTTNVVGTDPGLIDATVAADVTESAMFKDFRLLPTSSCINHGDSTGTNADTLDYVRQVRIYGTSIDIGACEFNPGAFASTGIRNQYTQPSVSVYPNPAVNELTIVSLNKISTLAIINIAGQTMLSHACNTNKLSMDISSLSKGIYFVSVNDGELMKFVKE